MSLIYGVWRQQSCPQTIEDRNYFTQSFADWKCDYRGQGELGPVAFGSNVFRIYPESKNEQQPLKDNDSQILLMADCRLDNREELSSSLGIDAIDTRNTPDSFLILASYERWGKDCFARLEGDFAIALWDNRENELILARDVMGVRPLAYATWKDGAAFCSSIPELYHLSSVPRDLDDIELAAQFAGHPTDRERTPFEAIKCVHPGSIVTISARGISKEIFKHLKLRPLSKDERNNPAPYIAELLKESIRKRTRGESDIVCELSGGFDSGTVAALTAQILKGTNRKLTAISWTPSLDVLPLMSGGDERKQIQWMEQRYGFKCHYFPYESPDEPIESYSFRSTFRTRSISAIGNSRIIFSGWGGDECVSYYLRSFHPHMLLADGLYSAATRLFSDFIEMPFGYRAPLRLIRSIMGTYISKRQRKRFAADKSFLINEHITPQWRQRLSEHFGEGLLSDKSPLNTQDSMLRALTRAHLEFRSSKETLDAATIGCSMTYPMLDHLLVTFVLSLPARHFNYDSRKRKLFRSVLDSLSIQLAPDTRKQEEALQISIKNELGQTNSLSIDKQTQEIQGKFICKNEKNQRLYRQPNHLVKCTQSAISQFVKKVHY